MQILNIGTGPNTGTGDNLRIACEKINNNFQELINSLSTMSQDIVEVDGQIQLLSVSVGQNISAINSSILTLNSAIQDFLNEQQVNSLIDAKIEPLATQQDVVNSVNGLINSSQLNESIATATQDFISEAAIDIKISTAISGLASESFVNTQITQALASYTPPIPTSITTVSGWSIAENANNNLEVKFGSSKYIEIDQTGLTLIDKLKITKNLFENIHDLGTITGAAVTVDSLNGPVQKLVIDNAAVTVTPIMSSGQAVTIRLSFLVDSTLVFTGVQWMDNLDPIWSTSMVNFLQLWKVDNTIYGIKIGEF